MIPNDLPIGQKFILVRSGEKYIKGKYLYWRGRPTKRFRVYKLDRLGNKIKDGDLSLQCQVKPILTINNVQKEK